MSTRPADGSASEQAKQGAQQATEQVKGAAREGAQQARDRARDEVDRRSTEAGEQASATADAIRQASSHLREQGQDAPARLVEQAAGHVERAGSWLQESDGDRILNDVEDFARRNPLAVIAGGVVVGFALSRLLKASSRDRYERMPALPPARRLPTSTAPAGDGVGATSPPTIDPATSPRI